MFLSFEFFSGKLEQSDKSCQFLGLTTLVFLVTSVGLEKKLRKDQKSFEKGYHLEQANFVRCINSLFSVHN